MTLTFAALVAAAVSAGALPALPPAANAALSSSSREHAVWSAPGLAVADDIGRLFLFDHDRIARVSPASGDLTWSMPIAAAGADASDHPSPLDSRCIDDDGVLVHTETRLQLLDVDTGLARWSIDLAAALPSARTMSILCQSGAPYVVVETAHGVSPARRLSVRKRDGAVVRHRETIGIDADRALVVGSTLLLQGRTGAAGCRITGVDLGTGNTAWHVDGRAALAMDIDRKRNALFVTGDRALRRIDPANGRVLWQRKASAEDARTRLLPLDRGEVVWVDDRQLLRLDASTGATRFATPVIGRFPVFSVAADASLWVNEWDADANVNRVSRFAEDGRLLWSRLMPESRLVVDGRRDAFFALGKEGLTRIEPRDGHPLWTAAPPRALAGLTVDELVRVDAREAVVTASAPALDGTSSAGAEVVVVAFDVVTGALRWTSAEHTDAAVARVEPATVVLNVPASTFVGGEAKPRVVALAAP